MIQHSDRWPKHITQVGSYVIHVDAKSGQIGNDKKDSSAWLRATNYVRLDRESTIDVHIR